ncbi:MAG: hypothetical protein ACU84Q_02770 [Gammaproteobacteria bacterium]
MHSMINYLTHYANQIRARHKARVWVLGVLFASFVSSAAAKPPDFPAPPKSSVASVAQDMNLHGRVTTIRMFTTPNEVDDVLEFYKEIWSEPVSRKSPNYAQEDRAMAPWRLITRVESGYAMTVQVQAGDAGSWGYLAISALPEGGEPVAGASAPPSMRGSEVLSNITHNDQGISGQTAVIKNKFPVMRNVEFYRDKFNAWRVDNDKAVAKGQIHTLRFTRGRTTVVITINGGDAESEIVINKTKRSLL